MSKSIKFNNNIYLDSTSVVNGTTALNSELTNMKNETGTRVKHYDNATTNTNLNTYTTTGIYQMGQSYSNAPVSGTIYGTLVVITSRRHAWTAGDYSNWIWQIMFTGYNVYMRQSSNSDTWGAWVQISSGSPNAIVESTETYTKYSNGLMIQHFKFTINCSLDAQWGSGFEKQVTGGQFPVAFKKLYSCQVTSVGRGCFIEFIHGTFNGVATHAIQSGFLWRPISDNGAKYDYNFFCYAIGTWK